MESLEYLKQRAEKLLNEAEATLRRGDSSEVHDEAFETLSRARLNWHEAYEVCLRAGFEGSKGDFGNLWHSWTSGGLSASMREVSRSRAAMVSTSGYYRFVHRDLYLRFDAVLSVINARDRAEIARAKQLKEDRIKARQAFVADLHRTLESRGIAALLAGDCTLQFESEADLARLCRILNREER